MKIFYTFKERFTQNKLFNLFALCFPTTMQLLLGTLYPHTALIWKPFNPWLLLGVLGAISIAAVVLLFNTLLSDIKKKKKVLFTILLVLTNFLFFLNGFLQIKWLLEEFKRSYTTPITQVLGYYPEFFVLYTFIITIYAISWVVMHAYYIYQMIQHAKKMNSNFGIDHT